MRWKVEQNPIVGQIRYLKKFLLFPRHSHWEDIAFVNEQEVPV